MPSNKEFKEGLKATSLFGGVQVFTILISIIKSKMVAVLLGPTGMGINGIFDSTIHMLSAFTGFGLGVSAVRDISEAHSSGDQKRFSRTLTVLRKLVWITGVFGLLLCLILSPFLSELSFDNSDYVFAFAAISVTLLFTQLSAGQKALLQGTRHFGYMAKASVIGSIVGLITSVPLYYFLGIKGIVPAIIIFSFSTLVLSWYYSRKVPFSPIKISYREAFHEGRDMAQMGFFISLQTLLSLFTAYIIRIFISRVGGVADVGLFVAGFAIVDTYVGMVFSSMSTEYYPRLSSHSKAQASEFSSTINQQIEIAIILISPLICLFLVFGNWAVILLYSEKFLPITIMMCLAILSNYFKAPAWSIAFSFLAKGDSRAFLLNELLSSTINTGLKLFFYYKWGLTGIGTAFLLSYFIYFFQVNMICRYRYDYHFDRNILKTFIPQLSMGAACFFLFIMFDTWARYFGGCIIIFFSLLVSYKEICKYVNLERLLKNKLKR